MLEFGSINQTDYRGAWWFAVTIFGAELDSKAGLEIDMIGIRLNNLPIWRSDVCAYALDPTENTPFHKVLNRYCVARKGSEARDSIVYSYIRCGRLN